MVTDRWKALGLGRLHPGQNREVSTADLLFHALAPEEVQDPVEGMITGVREDLDALAVLADEVLGASLNRLARRLEVAVALLRQADGRLAPEGKSPEEPAGGQGEGSPTTPS